MKKHHLLILIIIVLGCLVTFQALKFKEPEKLFDLERDYRIKVPEDSEYLTLIGELSSAPFPLTQHEALMSHYEDQITGGSKYLVRDVLVIEAPNPLNESKREIFYMFQDGSGMVAPRSSRFYKPGSTGYKLLGGVILTEINEVYKIGLTVEVGGPAFKYTRLGSQYNLVKVEKIRIRETWRLPLIVSHHIDMMRGDGHCLLSGERRVDFPLEFPIGLTTIQGEFGNAEHNFHVLLNPNETIRIEFNSTAPVNFGFMKPDAFINHGYYWPTSTSLAMADPEDFHIKHTEIQSLKTEFTAPERGFYNLVFKACNGRKGTVVLKITRTCPEEEPSKPEVIHCIPSITSLEIKNPEIALKYGIRGYIEINSAPGTPKTLTIKGKELNVTILLHFVSHSPNFTETEVNLDPKGDEGLIVEKCLGDGSGCVKLNDYVSYNLSGRIKLEAGETLPVTMTIRAPKGVTGISIPLRAVGITADVPIIHNMEENIDI